MIRPILCLALALAAIPSTLQAQLVLVHQGQARAAIYAPARVMEDSPAQPAATTPFASRQAHQQQQLLRASILDLARCLQDMTGAQIPIITGLPNPSPSHVPILVGDLAQQRWGEVGKTYPYHQAFRVIADASALGLYGESDLAASYAIYEILDRLGCRWYMPGPLGEVIPRRPSISLSAQDLVLTPGTITRGGPGDANYQRRNRLGGMVAPCSYGSVEGYITPQQRRENPHWQATIDGQPHPLRLKWSDPQVAPAIAQRILLQQEKDPQPGVSFFLAAGFDLDQSAADSALDAGDLDPLFGTISASDRLMVLANRVARQLAPTHPDIRLLVSAYNRATRAPLREIALPQVVPVIVPSVYDRAHPMTDDRVPNNPQLRQLIQGWGRAAPAIGCYAYEYHLAEPAAPNPMIARYSSDLPWFLANNGLYWIPEAVANFESSLPALWLAARLTWNPARDPAQEIQDLMRGFYGSAAPEMTAYWLFIDQAWTTTPAYAGAHFAYLKRFPLPTLEQARVLMNAARSAALSDAEKQRVDLAHQSLQQFEAYMALRRDLVAGRWNDIDQRGRQWLAQARSLAKNHADDVSFTPMGAGFFETFCQGIYADAAQIAREGQLLTPQPICLWRWRAEPASPQPQTLDWDRPDLDDSAWDLTDVTTDTWSNLGLHNYFGSLWYRAKIDLPALPEKSPIWLWLAGTDGKTRVSVNGQSVPWVDARNQRHAEHVGFNQPLRFDLSAAVRPGPNLIAIRCQRLELNEIGTGGLLGPAAVMAQPQFKPEPPRTLTPTTGGKP